MEDLAKCNDCGYIGNIGLWKGTYKELDGVLREFSGNVRLDGKHWDCDDILPKPSKEFDGMCQCPFCDSLNFD